MLGSVRWLLLLGLLYVFCVELKFYSFAPIRTEYQASQYLTRYGYLKPVAQISSQAFFSYSSIVEALKAFQKFAGLEQTGEMDTATMEVMNLPRCGVPDILSHNTTSVDRRVKRFSLQGSKWSTTDLSYNIARYTQDLERSLIDLEIGRAFKVWSEFTPLTFNHKRNGPVHIELLFATGDHGDGQPFDGPGKTLAHAFFPQFGGDVHFDDDEGWTLSSYNGVNLLQTAAHEIGHALGLEHSEVQGALMAPFYRGYKPTLRLAEDDIAAIQALYGDMPTKKNYNYKKHVHADTAVSAPPAAAGNWPPRLPNGRRGPEEAAGGGSNPKPNPGMNPAVQPDLDLFNTVNPGYPIWTDIWEPPPPPPDPGFGGTSAMPDICMMDRMDAITMNVHGETFVFRGEYYWKLADTDVIPGYPRRISEGWGGLPSHLDAALSWPDGKIYFFKGSYYWRWQDNAIDPGYPKQIRDGFAGIPDNIDAAFVWGGNDKTYFIKGERYWRYDRGSNPPVASSYPRPLSVWSGLPKKIEAAFQWKNGKTYFFVDNSYYRFDDRNFRVDPSYPRTTNIWWFGCDAVKSLRFTAKESEKLSTVQKIPDTFMRRNTSARFINKDLG
ncbi:matrix metalloproteinase-14-like [Paramacrobiotus metropolitanus]|uniref:matrix metalloproteinase-14-like n=1 Tax=Paramacrobiotus metropolitanus TaxID=2943436 RepID=UPI00244601F6|nr:matrix metalloproteinase-14-like [Paramacrobiotus metropolitanus]